MYSVWPLSFTIPKSAIGSGVSVSVDVLSVGSGSVVPTGAVIVAVFTKLPVAPISISPVMVYTMKLPTPASIFTNEKTSPEPVVAPCTEAFPVAAVLHIAFNNDDGNRSATAAPTTSDGPTLLTVTV